MANSKLIGLAMIANVQLGSAYTPTPCKQPARVDCVEPFWDPHSNDATQDPSNSWKSATKDPWNSWKSSHKIAYNSAEEETHRFGVWANNTLRMMQMNSQNLSFSWGWNSRSDLTTAELGQLLGAIREFPMSMEGVLGSTHQGVLHHHGKLTDLPSEVDWSLSDTEVVTYVRDQGHCGDCWAHSAAGALEGALAIAIGWTTSLSVQQFVDCAGSGSCKGGNEKRALDWTKNHAVCSEDSYPETGRDGGCKKSCDQMVDRGSVWGTYTVTPKDEGSLCMALGQRPISVAVGVDDAFQHYGGGILSGKSTTQLNHAVLLVGYGYWDGDAFWKVKNSWGTTFGLDGYILMRRGPGHNQHGIMSEPVGVYVFGPYNPSLSLTNLQGVRISPPTMVQVV